TIISNKEKETDILLAVYIAIHSSVRGIDHLSEIYNRISKDTVRLHRTKCSLLIKKVIAPTLLNDLLHDLKNCPYSLLIDENTDVGTVKYLCICVRYFSKKTQKILVCFLGLIEIERASAECLYTKLKEFLTNLGLHLINIIGIGTDGANNLCGQRNSLYIKLKEDNPNIQLIRCICHSLNNASSKTAELLP
ncbi:Zinc finger MYM-type protein 1, partial [Harpegnathos saltator]